MASDVYSERLDELSAKALESLESFFSTLVQIGEQTDVELDVRDIGRSGMGLVARARAEILGGINLIQKKSGNLIIKRATHDNKLGLIPETMVEAEIYKAKTVSAQAHQEGGGGEV